MKVTLPLCMNTVLSGFLIIFVFALGAYELPFILGATIPKALPVLAYLEYTKPDLRGATVCDGDQWNPDRDLSDCSSFILHITSPEHEEAGRLGGTGR